MNTVVESVTIAQWFALAGVFLAAGLLRGFTGFGFAMVAVPFGALWLPPEVIVPVVFLLSAYIGLFEALPAARVCNARSLIWMMVSSAIGMPLGLLALLIMPLKLVYIAIGSIVLLSLLPLLARPEAVRFPPGTGLVAGFLSGVFNGIAAMSGPPVIYYFMRGPFTYAEARASLIIFFFVTSFFSVVTTVYAGLLSWEEILISLGAFPLIALSSWGGAHLFARFGNRSYRQVGLLCLAGAAIAAFAKAAFSS